MEPVHSAHPELELVEVPLTLPEHQEPPQEHPELLILPQEDAMELQEPQALQANTLAAPPEPPEPVDPAIFRDQDTNHTMPERTESNDLISYEFLNIEKSFTIKSIKIKF